MHIAKVLFIVFLLTVCMISKSTADIFRVPADFATIGAALNRASSRNDSVLVAEGVYTGIGNTDLSFESRNVTLISEYGPENCIIDGEGSANTAIIMERGCVLSGFTIQRFDRNAVIVNHDDDFTINNCLIEGNISESSWSAIRIEGTIDGIIKNCTFRDNSSRIGGAISILSNSEVNIESCLFTFNHADSIGGALFLSMGGDANIRNCLFVENTGRIHGGAIAIVGRETDANISFTDFLGNNAELGWGGAIYKDENSMSTIRNCIFWDNTARNYGMQIAARLGREDRYVDLSHCVVEGGDANGENGGWFGDEVILEEVRYEQSQRNPLWGPNYYFQIEGSAGINAGSGTVEELNMQNMTICVDLAPDDGIVDIGFHYDKALFPRIGTLFGVVRDVASGESMQGVDIVTSLRQSSRTTHNGRWIIPEALTEERFTITASKPGFNDSTIVEIDLNEDDQLEINFGMLHPTFDISVGEISAFSDLGDSGIVDFTITNSGNGPLEWDSKLELTDEFDIEPWTPLETFFVGADINENIGGVVFVNDHYYFTDRLGNELANLIFKMDKEGALVDSFPLPFMGLDGRNLLDLAYDGENFWSIASDSAFCFTLEGERITAFECDQMIRYIAWDSEYELLRMGNGALDIIAMDRDGNVVEEAELDRLGLRIRGFAYWPEDPDGFPLYFLARRGDHDPTSIYKMNPATNDTMLAYTLNFEGGRPSSGFISSDMDPYSVNFMCIAEALEVDGSDRIEVLTMAANTAWMMLNPVEGSVNPGSEIPLTITLYNALFDYGVHQSWLRIYHNAEGGEVELPISYTISDVPWNDPYLPYTTAIESIYPNPFNAETVINYSLNTPGWVTMTIYDLAGREIEVIMDDFQTAGNHHLNVNASTWSTGIYLAKLQSGNAMRIAKLACVK